MQSRPWWFYAGLLVCVAVLTVAVVKRLRYVYVVTTTDLMVDTWTNTACDRTTCARVDALLDSANARLPKAPPLPGFVRADTSSR